MEISRRIELPCPVEEAWAVLTDWERQADWMLDADRVEVISEQREGVGVRLAVRTRIAGVPAFTEPIEVTGWEPPHRLAISHGGPVAGEGSWEIEALPGGRSGFTWTERVRLRFLGGELAAQAYAPILGRLMGRAMGGLRRAVIASGPSRRG